MKIIGDGGHAKVVRDILHLMSYAELPNSAIVAIGDNASRKKESERCYAAFVYSMAIHPTAVIADDTDIGEGTVICAGAIIQPNVKIGKHCIINTGATVDHDCVIGDYAHIAPGAHLCGHVEVGEGALVGVGVGIAPMCKIPAWVLVKARKLEMEPLYKEMADAV